MKKLLFTLGLISSTLLVAGVPVASANTTNCTTNYGGGTTCNTTNITINKTVQNPSNGNYVDNLGVNDTKYNAGQDVNFQITITNTGNVTLNNVNVTDYLPQYTSFVSAPGSHNGNTIYYTIGTLNPGATDTETVTAQVANSNTLPSGITCLTNQATANDNNGDNVSDTAQFCAQNNVLGTTSTTTSTGLTVYPAPKLTSTPPTGPDAVSLLALIPAAFAGLTLRKKAIKG